MKNNRESQFFSTREETGRWLDKYHVCDYIINNDLSVDVNGNVNLSYRNLKTIHVKFNKITHSFSCNNNKLTSLAGSPKSVGGSFYCENNQLTNLAEFPKSIGFDCWCRGNQLNSISEINNSVFRFINFNIDKKNFNPKELIQVLKRAYLRERKCYTFTCNAFKDIIKPQIEKEALQQKLSVSTINIKTNKIFI